MKNTKMKYKIFFLMMLLIISLNNAACEMFDGEISSFVYDETDSNVPFLGSAASYEIDGFFLENGEYANNLKSIHMYMDNAYWEGSEASYGKSDVVYKYLGDEVGSGYMYFWRMNTDSIPGYDIVYIKVYIDNGLLNLPSSSVMIDIVGDVTSSIASDAYKSETLSGASYDPKAGVFCHPWDESNFLSWVGDHTSKGYNTFYNKYYYSYDEDEGLLSFNLTRDSSNESRVKIINNGGIELINETALQDTFLEVYSDDITNFTWDFYATDYNNVNHFKTLNFIPEIEDLTPTLTTDKLSYNTSEQITISFTNIDEIEGYVGKSLSLYILYPVIDDYKDYDAKYMLHLYGDRRDETFTLNTSFLTPQNVYHLAVCIDGDFHQIDDSLIISDTFYVYADTEYINTNCNPESNCYTYNGGDISIYYKINNNSNIIIKDNEGNTIQTYYNIIGENEINYYVPDDLNQLNSYPNWKIYLNNTEYETNYSTDVIIYWSLISTPTPTPIYTSVPIDENISKQVEQLKEESKPIFDLLYGLSELVIDNPDYDDDNIITESEMNNWFNSLIPIVLILLIVIVYTGLTKKR